MVRFGKYDLPMVKFSTTKVLMLISGSYACNSTAIGHRRLSKIAQASSYQLLAYLLFSSYKLASRMLGNGQLVMLTC